MMPETGPGLDGRRRKRRLDEVAHGNATQAARVGYKIPVHRRAARRTKVERRRTATYSRDAVKLQAVEAFGLATDLDDLIHSEVRTNLEDTAGALLAKVAMADRDRERLADHVKL